MTKYQEQILKDLENGAKLQCTEGSNYKAWLVYPDGTERKVRRDSAEKVCYENDSLLIFGLHDGIIHRKALIIDSVSDSLIVNGFEITQYKNAHPKMLSWQARHLVKDIVFAGKTKKQCITWCRNYR